MKFDECEEIQRNKTIGTSVKGFIVSWMFSKRLARKTDEYAMIKDIFYVHGVTTKEFIEGFNRIWDEVQERRKLNRD